MRQLLIVRHCQSSGQAPDDPLTDVGMQQAKTLADFLADHPIDAIASSSYLRARQTIAPFAERTGLSVQLDDRLTERVLSADPIDNWREVLRASYNDLDLRAPGGESGREVQQRGWAALNELLASDAQLPVAVSHGNLISLIFNSLDASFGYEQWAGLSNPDVYLLKEIERNELQFERIWK